MLAELLLAAVPAVINLSWTDTSDNEDFFELYRQTICIMTVDGVCTDSDWGLEKTVPADTQATTDSISDIPVGTQLCYKIRAVNSVGASDFSNVACATIPEPTPGVPAGPTLLEVQP